MGILFSIVFAALIIAFFIRRADKRRDESPVDRQSLDDRFYIAILSFDKGDKIEYMGKMMTLVGWESEIKREYQQYRYKTWIVFHYLSNDRIMELRLCSEDCPDLSTVFLLEKEYKRRMETGETREQIALSEWKRQRDPCGTWSRFKPVYEESP